MFKVSQSSCSRSHLSSFLTSMFKVNQSSSSRSRLSSFPTSMFKVTSILFVSFFHSVEIYHYHQVILTWNVLDVPNCFGCTKYFIIRSSNWFWYQTVCVSSNYSSCCISAFPEQIRGWYDNWPAHSPDVYYRGWQSALTNGFYRHLQPVIPATLYRFPRLPTERDGPQVPHDSAFQPPHSCLSQCCEDVWG